MLSNFESFVMELVGFERRHIGINQPALQAMLNEVKHENLDSLISQVVPEQIREKDGFVLPEA